MNDAIAKLLIANNVPPDSFTPSASGEDVYQGEVTGQVMALWAALLKGSRETGYYPIIRGAADKIQELPDRDPASILANVPTGSIRELLQPRADALLESFRSILPELPDGTPDLPASADIDQLASFADKSGIYSFSGKSRVNEEWPTEESKPLKTSFGFHTVRELKGNAAVIALLRVQHSYEIPAYLNFGGWNECPEPELQVAVLREWRAECGARPACMTGDVLECIVGRCPMTEAQSMKLATEQWIFCDDIVGQGTQSVRKLAMEIWKSPTWFFWWD